MKKGVFKPIAILAVLVGMCAVSLAAEKELSAAAKAALGKETQTIAGWASAPEIVAAVKEQNAKGPLAGMDNEKWKAVKRSDPIVKSFQDSPAGQFLAGKVSAGKGLYAEAFLSGAQGEKVAFVSKTSAYIHKGKPKFDQPFTTGKPWQGPVEFDESTQSYTVQVAVPVLDGGKPIGVLVVGINTAVLPGA